MIEKGSIPKDEIFFTFDTDDEKYQIVFLSEVGPIYGIITQTKDNQEEILDIKTWASRFVMNFGNEEIFDVSEIKIHIEQENKTIIFTGPFDLEISKGCNLTYESNTI